MIAKRLPGAPHETLLVLDGTIGQNAVQQAKTFARAVPVTGLVVTKLDGTARGGVVVAVHEAHRRAGEVPRRRRDRPTTSCRSTPRDVRAELLGERVSARRAPRHAAHRGSTRRSPTSRASGRRAPRRCAGSASSPRGDLLYHVPHRYEDASTVAPISSLEPGMQGTVIGTRDLEGRASRRERACESSRPCSATTPG